ncbi:MAG: hypothetical protein O2948_13175 [Proteobacteria bacterium]|nr:hypothetical protein [Pseudomonadota bacterium]
MPQLLYLYTVFRLRQFKRLIRLMRFLIRSREPDLDGTWLVCIA